MSSLDPSVLFAALPFSLWQWLLVELAIVLAYVVFGIAGFGTALVAGPLLAGVLPLSQIIPLLVLLDFSASFGNWLPARRQVAVTELKRLLPCMLLGCALGAYGLLALRAELLMLALGVFVSSTRCSSSHAASRAGGRPGRCPSVSSAGCSARCSAAAASSTRCT